MSMTRVASPSISAFPITSSISSVDLRRPSCVPSSRIIWRAARRFLARACNNHVKFDQLLVTARQIGASRIATGHYARVEQNAQTGRWNLLRALDLSKDQSYFLFGLTQEQLAHAEFPLGNLSKQAVREMARRSRLPVAEKPESQEICFVPSGNYTNFIEAYRREQRAQSENESEPSTAQSEQGRRSGRTRYHLGSGRGHAFRRSAFHRGTAPRPGHCLAAAALRLANRSPTRSVSRSAKKRTCGAIASRFAT